MRVIRILEYIAALVLGFLIGATLTIAMAHAAPRCAPRGIGAAVSRHPLYSVCSFSYDNQQVRVLAVRITKRARLKPFGQPGQARSTSRMLSATGAVAGTNGDYVWSRTRTVKHPWVRDGRHLRVHAMSAFEFVEYTDGSASIGRQSLVYDNEWGIRDAFGGMPMLVRQGQNVGLLHCLPQNCKRSCGRWHCDNPLFGPNPRTVVGDSRGCEDGRARTPCYAYLVTVDGRRWPWSIGLRFPATAQLMIRLGSYNAMNLDGGGSTEMWVRHPGRGMCQMHTFHGCVIDRPAYRTERTVVQGIGYVP